MKGTVHANNINILNQPFNYPLDARRLEYSLIFIHILCFLFLMLNYLLHSLLRIVSLDAVRTCHKRLFFFFVFFLLESIFITKPFNCYCCLVKALFVKTRET